MIQDRALLDRVLEDKTAFGEKCGKFSGALTVHVLRQALCQARLPVSDRDVFIRGVPIEIDLLLVRPSPDTAGRLLYEPKDVLVALEIKSSGSFGRPTIDKTRADFARIKAANPQIMCAYVALAERDGYPWAVTRKNLGHPAYTLFWHNSSVRCCQYESSGDWAKLLKALAAHVRDVGVG